MKKLYKKAIVGASIGVMQYGVMVVQAAQVEKSPTSCK